MYIVIVELFVAQIVYSHNSMRLMQLPRVFDDWRAMRVFELHGRALLLRNKSIIKNRCTRMLTLTADCTSIYRPSVKIIKLL